MKKARDLKDENVRAIGFLALDFARDVFGMSKQAFCIGAGQEPQRFSALKGRAMAIRDGRPEDAFSRAKGRDREITYPLLGRFYAVLTKEYGRGAVDSILEKRLAELEDPKDRVRLLVQFASDEDAKETEKVLWKLIKKQGNE